MKNIKIYLLLIMAFSFCGNIFSQDFSQEETFESVAFRAMQDEMNRNMSNLKLDKLKSPYYISYLITDANIYSVDAKLGSLVDITDMPLRNHEVSVMVGSHQRNNLNFVNENRRVNSFVIPMTLENDYDAICRSLWIATDNEYKVVAEPFEAKLSAINQQNIPQAELDLADFSSIPPFSKIYPSTKISFDKKNIETITKELSSIFENYPKLTNSKVNISIYSADALYLNSEEIKYKVPFYLVCINVYAEAIATDGGSLSDYINLYFNTPDQIPALDVLKQQVNQMAIMLTELREAPVISESYSGPVMFEDDAVGEIISQSFIDNANGLIAGRKPIVGISDPERLQRNLSRIPKENKLEQFVNKKIISRELSVSAVHDKKTYNGVPLIGYYEVDAQGVVPAQKTVLIENGVLKTLLNDRIPTPHNAASNGHNVFTLQSGSISGTLGSGILELTSTETKNYSALKESLIAAAKEEDYEYAYIVRKIYKNSMKPVYVYRVSVKDGKEELVRSAKLSDIYLKSFKRIIGVADTQAVYNTLRKGKRNRLSSEGFLTGTPASFIVPRAIVFQELELEKDKEAVLRKETIVPSPLMSEGSGVSEK